VTKISPMFADHSGALCGEQPWISFTFPSNSPPSRGMERLCQRRGAHLAHNQHGARISMYHEACYFGARHEIVRAVHAWAHPVKEMT